MTETGTTDEKQGSGGDECRSRHAHTLGLIAELWTKLLTFVTKT
jgi:hypothetical protein